MFGFETMSFWLVKYNAATLNRPQINLHLSQSKKSRRTWRNIFSAPYYIILITKRIFPTCLTWRSAAPSLLHLNNCLPLFGFFSFKNSSYRRDRSARTRSRRNAQSIQYTPPLNPDVFLLIFGKPWGTLSASAQSSRAYAFWSNVFQEMKPCEGLNPVSWVTSTFLESLWAF